MKLLLSLCLALFATQTLTAVIKSSKGTVSKSLKAKDQQRKEEPTQCNHGLAQVSAPDPCCDDTSEIHTCFHAHEDHNNDVKDTFDDKLIS